MPTEKERLNLWPIFFIFFSGAANQKGYAGFVLCGYVTVFFTDYITIWYPITTLFSRIPCLAHVIRCAGAIFCGVGRGKPVDSWDLRGGGIGIACTLRWKVAPRSLCKIEYSIGIRTRIIDKSEWVILVPVCVYIYEWVFSLNICPIQCTVSPLCPSRCIAPLVANENIATVYVGRCVYKLACIFVNVCHQWPGYDM